MTGEELKQYQDGKSTHYVSRLILLCFFLPITGCDSYSENNAQLRAIIEELSKSSVSM